MAALFREARTRSRAVLAGWTAVQSAVLWVATLVALPLILLRIEAAWGIEQFTILGQVPLAMGLFGVCSLLNASAGAAMVRWGRGTPLPTACAPRLVVRGPYAYVRNPMALFGLGQGMAVGLGLGSWSMMAVTAAAGLGWHVLVRPTEEADLARRLGADYEAYRGEVRCWIPRFAPYVSSSTTVGHRGTEAGHSDV
ncbi:MAG: isoprenylcysteine carboxylmethyltransferase family protein [Bacteroidota bacterium]